MAPRQPVVAVFVGTRADLGPLTPVLTALRAAADLSLRIFTGVMYAAHGLAAVLPGPTTVEEWAESIVPLALPMDQVDPEHQVEQGALLGAATGRALRQLDVDVLVVLGDRWELLYVVPPAVLLGVPVVHLHGGEVTEGALDERVRHAVTKLADQHCVASEDAARRVRQLGEPADRVHVTGAPGLDRLAVAEPMTDAELAVVSGLPRIDRPVALFTYHPPTTHDPAQAGPWAREAAEATLDECGTVIASHPGMDVGREGVLAALEEVAQRHPDRFVVLEALGREYPRALASVDVVVGNSSSGVIEAATVHVPAVDVGDRQQGRLRGDNVLHAEEGRAAVAAAVRAALGPEWRERAPATVNPYGDGKAAPRILDIVREAVGGDRVKEFVDLEER